MLITMDYQFSTEIWLEKKFNYLLNFATRYKKTLLRA